MYIQNHYKIDYFNNNISFGLMKKNQFRNFDFFVVERFKAHIEKFNSESDYQKWAQKMYESCIGENYSGRTEYTRKSRTSILSSWKDFLESNIGKFTGAEKLLIIKGITKNLKPNEETLPPVLNRDVFSKVLLYIKEELSQNRLLQLDFGKIYQEALRQSYNVGKKSKWVIIKSQEKDPKNYVENLEKLEMLSHRSWCLKSYMADQYLKQGNVHIYYENGEPKLAIRFYKNTIVEIQGEKNNGVIPDEYVEILDSHIKKNKYLILDRINKHIKKAS